jgi:hypothetical protein
MNRRVRGGGSRWAMRTHLPDGEGSKKKRRGGTRINDGLPSEAIRSPSRLRDSARWSSLIRPNLIMKSHEFQNKDKAKVQNLEKLTQVIN